MKLGKRYKVADIPHKLGPLRQHFPDVVEVADLIEPALITIKACDNDHAKKHSHTECVMAQALLRLGAAGAYVGKSRTYIILNGGKLAVRTLTRESVTREMTSYDRAGGFDEGTYGLSAINPHHRLGKKHRGGSDKSRKPGSNPSKLVGVHRTGKMRD